MVAEFEIDDAAGALLLQTALEARDRMRECQKKIKADGTTVTDRFGQVRGHPLLSAERDARSAMLAAIKQLQLVREEPEPEGSA